MASRKTRFDNKTRNNKVVAIPSRKKNASTDGENNVQLYNLYMMY